MIRSLKAFFRALTVPYLLAFLLFVPYQLAVYGLEGGWQVLNLVLHWFLLPLPLAALATALYISIRARSTEHQRSTLGAALVGGLALVLAHLALSVAVVPTVSRLAGPVSIGAGGLTWTEQWMELRRTAIDRAEGVIPLPESRGPEPVTRESQEKMARFISTVLAETWVRSVVPFLSTILGWTIGFWAGRIPDRRVRHAHALAASAIVMLSTWVGFDDFWGDLHVFGMYGSGLVFKSYSWVAAVVGALPWVFIAAVFALLWPTWITLRYPRATRAPKPMPAPELVPAGE